MKIRLAGGGRLNPHCESEVFQTPEGEKGSARRQEGLVFIYGGDSASCEDMDSADAEISRFVCM